tara:strand:+ start:281 stop:1240 length:960 start_codon:yes stop_codon:yes gene_type:complete
MQKLKHKFEPRVVEGYRLNIKPNYIVQTPILSGTNQRKSKKQIANEKNLSNTETSGILSKKSKQKLLNSINWLVASAKNKKAFHFKTQNSYDYKLTFITLTIPIQENNQVTEKEFKSLINTWLTYARQYLKLKNYIWKIEAHKDGRLHIHITADTFLHYQKIRASWNAILQKRGLLEYHFSKFGNYNPNSTDIHSVRNVNNIQAYISKYMTKASAICIQFKGRIWGCNYLISEANKCVLIATIDEMEEWIKPLSNPNIEYKSIESLPDCLGNTKSLGYIYFLKLQDWKNLMFGKIKEVFINHIKLIQGININSQIKLAY